MKITLASAARVCLGLMVFIVLVLIGLVCSIWWGFGVGAPSPEAPRAASAGKEDVEYLKAKLDLYEKRADDLKALSAGLLGLSTLYALALGFGSYWNARSSERDAKSLLDQIKADAQVSALEAKTQLEQSQRDLQRTQQDTKELIAQIKQEHPLFAHMERSLSKMSDRLMVLLPLMDWTDRSYMDLKPSDKEEILFYENAVATMFQFLDPSLFQKEASRIYQGLGNFYGLRYHEEKKLTPQGATCPKDNLDRSRFYLDRAVEADEKNFAALNDRGYLALVMEGEPLTSEGRRFFTKSLEAEPKQQRSRYNLAWLDHREGQFAKSEKLLQGALAQNRWQQEGETSQLHLRDINYNLACSRVRRAGTIEQPQERQLLLEQAWDNLKAAFPRAGDSYPQLEANFLEDITSGGKPEGELVLLAEHPGFQEEVLQLKTLLQQG